MRNGQTRRVLLVYFLSRHISPEIENPQSSISIPFSQSLLSPFWVGKKQSQ